MLVIGIDPGLTGAMCLIDSEHGLRDVVDIPTCENGLVTGSMKRWVDPHGIEQLLREWSGKWGFAAESVHSVIERPIPMPSLPAQTIASQFDTFGVIRAVLQRHAAVQCVAPNIWKKIYSFGKDKAEARACCKRLYPTAPVSRVKDHNRAEAILIGHWLVRTTA